MKDLSPSSPRVRRLYEDLAPQLVRIVASNLTAPDGLIEDACQAAWSQLISSRVSITPGSELGWLSTTATREALRQLRALRYEVSYEGEGEEGGLHALPAVEPGPERVVELRERLAEIHTLPVRQQRMLWLQGIGYQYAEIAEHTGDSLRTVERQLLRARRRVGGSA